MAATIEYYKGFDTYVIYGAETSYGAGATPASGNKFGKVTNFKCEMTNNFLRNHGMGDGRNAKTASIGKFDVSGSIDFGVDDFTAMQYAIGKINGAGTLADPYELQELANIGYDATNIPTLTLEVGSEGDTTDDVLKVTGVVFNTLSLDFSAGDVLKCTMDFTGKTVISSASLTSYTANTTKPVIFQQGSVLFGADIFECTKFSMTVDNGIQTYNNLGSRFIAQPVTGLRKYDFDLTFKMKNDTTAGYLSGTELRDYFYGSSNNPTTAGFVTSYALTVNIVEGVASTNLVAAIELENCYFESWSNPVDLEGGVTEISVKGFGLAGKTDGAANVPIRWYRIT